GREDRQAPAAAARQGPVPEFLARRQDTALLRREHGDACLGHGCGTDTYRPEERRRQRGVLRRWAMVRQRQRRLAALPLGRRYRQGTASLPRSGKRFQHSVVFLLRWSAATDGRAKLESPPAEIIDPAVVCADRRGSAALRRARSRRAG